jgi:hypothetical protein
MSDLKTVYQRGVQNLSAAYQAKISDYHYAQSNGDVDGMASAAMEMAGLEATAREFNNLANRAANPQQGAGAVDRWGLNADEREVAKNWTNDPDVSEDQKFRTYAEQKQKYQYQRQAGIYRDDQGRISK